MFSARFISNYIIVSISIIIKKQKIIIKKQKIIILNIHSYKKTKN